MSKSTGYIIGIALVIGIGAILQYFLCCGPGLAAGNQDVNSELIEGSGLPFAVKDPTGEFSFSTDYNFDFPASSYSYLTPIAPALEDGIQQLQSYLSDHESASLGINGYAFKGEENLSAFPTLGEARANAVKSAMIDRGISGNQLKVSGADMEASLPTADSVVRGPIAYSLTGGEDIEIIQSGSDNETEESSGDVSDIANDLKEEPMVLHFETGSAYVNLTTAERQLISRLNQYIDQNDQATIEIAGHTDNSGSPEMNQQLGKERADFLKSYLVRNGFQSNRIITVSRGQSEPISSNDTEAGRAKNRRAVMTITN